MKILYLIIQGDAIIGKIWRHPEFGFVITFDSQVIRIDDNIFLVTQEAEKHDEGKLIEMVLACMPVFAGIGGK